MKCIWESHLSEYLNGYIHFCLCLSCPDVNFFWLSSGIEHCLYTFGCKDNLPIL